jgi:uncharacterized heparinase superfamily protein
MQRLPLYLWTLPHLKAKQIAWLAVRRLLPSRHHTPVPAMIAQRTGIALSHPAASVSGGRVAAGEFRFLNQSRVFEGGRVDWVCADMPKLWRYNLHYFDYALDPRRTPQSVAALITDWIACNPAGASDAWEPYTVSLRTVNWIRFFLNPAIRSVVNASWLASLYQQCQWLERNIEYHILANHYLKNGKALFFAGMFFEGEDAERWRRLGWKILCEEADEQLLADGGHYERSPMYHSIVVCDYLDVLNLVQSSTGFNDDAAVRHLESKARKAVEFLFDMCLPDGRIPLFNDAAFGIAPEPDAILDYARAVLNYDPRRARHDVEVVEKAASGFFIIQNRDDKMVVDCGAVGPDYQPGHAHCDTLSYELALDGRRVIVDCGVHDYEDSAARRYARSTAAHNTVAVDDAEQSEVWGVFRVARRARPTHATLVKRDGSLCRFEGAHDGYRRLVGQVTHARTIEYDGARRWTVVDEIRGSGAHTARSYIHLHPGIRAAECERGFELRDSTGRQVATLRSNGAARADVVPGRYFPEFGIEQASDVIVLAANGQLPLVIAYTLEKVSQPRVVI